MDQTLRNKEILREFFALLGTPDIEGIKAFMAEDIQWVVPQDPSLSPLAGTRTKEQWEALYRGFLANMPAGVRYEIGGMTAEGDRVAVEAESHAETPRGHFNNRYHFLFELRDGKIVLAKEYADSLYMYLFPRQPA